MSSNDPFVPYGIARTADLTKLGLSRQQVARRVATGKWTRLTNGWIGNGSAEPVIEAAVRAGAAVTCISALRRSGVWTPSDPTTHLRFTDHALRTRKRGARSCAPKGPPLPVVRPVDGLRASVEAAAGCLRPDQLTAVLDSAFNRRLVARADVDEWFDRYPSAVRGAFLRCDPGAESGAETLVRLRLRRLRIKLRIQVQIADIGRVDLLVGDRLVIEVDSKEHHTSLSAYQADRARDRRLRAAGYDVIRLTYEDVMYRWETVEQDLLAIIRRGDHRWSRTKSRRSALRTA